MRNPTKAGVSPLSEREALGRLLADLGAETMASARFAGLGFDALPPYLHGYSAERPRYRRVAPFIPGRFVPVEEV